MNCGPNGLMNCCASLQVEGGAFYRGYDGVTTTPADYTSQAYPATVGSFMLDEFEVTVGRFRQFVNAWAGGWRPSAQAGKHGHLNNGSGLASSANQGTFESGWDTAWEANLATTLSGWDTNLACGVATWTPSAGANEKRPINCVSWYEAYAFCIWDGGFLPSEAEWNYAAAGGDEQRVYPWGAVAPGQNAALAAYSCYYESSVACSGVAEIAPVGMLVAGKGRFGQQDLAGNVSEWSLDSAAAYVTPCDNCSYVDGSTTGVLRGGFFGADAAWLMSSFRYNRPKGGHNIDTGFRCARSP